MTWQAVSARRRWPRVVTERERHRVTDGCGSLTFDVTDERRVATHGSIEARPPENDFALFREMWETPPVVAGFPVVDVDRLFPSAAFPVASRRSWWRRLLKAA